MRSLRSSLHQFIPKNFHDPIGLFLRLLKTKNTAAWFAMQTAILGVLLTPIDLFLEIPEGRRYSKAPKPKMPIIFVCGPPRSGTTLVEQVLIKNLSVAYLNNLTSLFPRSPITANDLFGKFVVNNDDIQYTSYYGKSLRLSGPNDALYLWDRWTITDRSKVPEKLSEAKKDDMVRFFGACEGFYRRPLVTKNNSLNTYASLVSEVLESSYFICLNRNPPFLAQSLLQARIDIHGSPETPYGVDEVNGFPLGDYIEDVCRQIRFHNRKIREQQQEIGSDRFWVIPYENFCAKPEELVARVSEQILQQPYDAKGMPPFKNANRVRIDPELFRRIEQELVDLTQSYH